MGIGWLFEKFVKPTSSDLGCYSRVTESPSEGSCVHVRYFLTVSLNLIFYYIGNGSRSQAGREHVSKPNSVDSVTTGFTNNSLKVVFKLLNYYQVQAL